MSVTEFGPRPCERVRRYLDSYLSNELLVETNHEVLRHLEACRDCAAQLESLARVRQALQAAVRRERAPAGLEARIHAGVRQRAPRRVFGGPQWSVALAASALLVLAGWAVFRSVALREGAGGGRAAALLGIGVADHVECAVAHGLKGPRPTAGQMAEALGAGYSDLPARVGERMPAGYEIALAHRCTVGGREFVHLVLEQRGRILSLAITRKRGESFDREGAAASLEASGIPIYQAAVRSYDVAGFETRDHLAFVVSGLGPRANSELAAGLAPEVRALLARLEA